MLKFDDLYEEIETAELLSKQITDKDVDKTLEDVCNLLAIQIKLSTLNLKLLHNIRANQSKTMVATGVKKIEPKKNESEKR